MCPPDVQYWRIKDAKSAKVTCTVFASPDSFYKGYNDPATSMNVSIGAQIIASADKMPGVWGPEEYFDDKEYFTELKKRHFRITMEIITEEEM